MPKVKVTNSKGLVQEGGNGIEFEQSPTYTTTALVAADSNTPTLGAGGFYTFSGSDGASQITASMPAVSSCAGAVWTMRSTSTGTDLGNGNVKARHHLTGAAADSASTSLFIFSGSYEEGYGRSYGIGGVGVEGTGQRFSWGDESGQAIRVVSDGNKFHVTPLTGTYSMQLDAWEA